MSVSDLIPLDTVKAFVRITTSDQDAVLDVLMRGAASWLTTRLSLFLEPAGFTEHLDGGLESLRPTVHPVTSVVSIIDRFDGSTVDPTAYRLEGDRIIYAGTGEIPTPWPTGLGRYYVAGIAGYAAGELPAAVELALLQLVARAYEVRGGKTGQGAAGVTDSFATWDSLATGELATMLEPLRKGSRF